MTKLEPTRTSSDLTATEHLRRLLDECGVEWDYGITGATTTRFSVNGIDLTFTTMRDGLVCSTILTPEQAIEATLGTGTCIADETETISVRDDTRGYYFDKHFTIHVMECSECGHTYEHVNGDYEFCPHCGRRVVEVNA